MSKPSVVLVHPLTAVRCQTYSGFSWPCLFFGFFWFMYKKAYLWALAALAASVFTGGLAWLAFPFFANDIHRKAMLAEGMRPEGMEGDGPPTSETHVRCPDCRELVRADARKCRHCGAGLVPQDLVKAA